MEHHVTVKVFRGHHSARCTCGRRWSNVRMDGGEGNHQASDMLRHMQAAGAQLLHSKNEVAL
jgi:hypothetical protein